MQDCRGGVERARIPPFRPWRTERDDGCILNPRWLYSFSPSAFRFVLHHPSCSVPPEGPLSSCSGKGRSLGAQIEADVQKALTDVFVRSAKPAGAGRTEISDLRCVGLVLRIAVDGGKSWSFRFRTQTGKQTRATIGRYPDVALTDARQRADDMRRAVAEGRNPVEEKRAARAPGFVGTFDALAGRYLDEHSRRRKRSSEGDERNLRKHVLPKWAGRAFAEIRRRDVIELVEGLVTDGKPTLANRVQSLISSVFTFAMDADLAEANPCHRLRKRGVERVGRRVLSDEEIRLFWSRIVEPPATRRTGLALRLTLLTGRPHQRDCRYLASGAGTVGRCVPGRLDHPRYAHQKRARPFGTA